MSNDLALITEDIYATREAFNAALSDRSMKFDQEAGFAVQLVQASDYLLKAALGNRQAVVNAVVNVAAIGLSLNPARKHAYLVPRKGASGRVQVNLDVSYIGLIELAVASGSIRWAQAIVVHENDGFKMLGLDKLPEHTFNPFATDRGAVVGVYVTAKTIDGDYLTELMSTAAINAIRDRSESWKSGKNSPWKSDWEAMARKTVIKAAQKFWPKTDRMDQAVHYLNTDGGEGIDFAAQVQAPLVSGSFDCTAAIEVATATQDEPALLKVYGEAMTAAAKAHDKEGAVRFKDAALAHRAVLRNKGGNAQGVQA